MVPSNILTSRCCKEMMSEQDYELYQQDVEEC